MKLLINKNVYFFIQVRSTASVDFVDEKMTKATAPLLPLRSSPPRVIKRKALQLGT